MTEKRSHTLILISASLAMLMVKLDAFIVNISLPTIAQTFGCSHDIVSLVLLAYLVASTATLLLFGMIRDGMKTVSKDGTCPEKNWPYDIKKFTVKPTAACYKKALDHQVLSYHRVPRVLDQIKGCLADGYPMVLGFTVYESFESSAVAKTGILNMPGPGEQVMGGHAVLAVGYDDKQGRFIIRNSWSAQWGMQGYFTMPYDYLLNENLSDDFWTVRLIEENPAIEKK